MARTKVLILGATGMLGHTLLKIFSRRTELEVLATVRNYGGLAQWFSPEIQNKIVCEVQAADMDTLYRALAEIKPEVVINCIGVIKQLAVAKDPLTSITLNALFPHRLALACKAASCRLIHISTDCVFSGTKGNYTEEDFSDATDLYGRTKFLGEVDYPHCVTLRTSIIGHELNGCYSLIDWFLAQEGQVNGYTGAVYTGFPTVEMARIIAEFVIPDLHLTGLYHVSSAALSKYELLEMVAHQYGKKIEIIPFADFRCDRSLDSTRFRVATGYVPPKWPDMIAEMNREKSAK